MELSARIKLVLDSVEMTDTALAQRIGCTQSAISQWRSGLTRSIKAEHAFALADLTGFSARWIALGQGPQKLTSDQARRAELLAQRLIDLPNDQLTLIERIFATSIR